MVNNMCGTSVTMTTEAFVPSAFKMGQLFKVLGVIAMGYLFYLNYLYYCPSYSSGSGWVTRIKIQTTKYKPMVPKVKTTILVTEKHIIFSRASLIPNAWEISSSVSSGKANISVLY